MIEGWLAGKLSGLVIFAVACLSVVLIPAVVVQTVRIDGLDIFGWYAVDGYRPLYLQAKIDLTTLRGNNRTLEAGITTCNASVDALKRAGDARLADAQRQVEEAATHAADLQRDIARLRAVKSSQEVCPNADMILRAGFQ